MGTPAVFSPDLSSSSSALHPEEARLHFESACFRDDYDRQPVGLSHNLSSLGLFAVDALVELANRYVGHPMDSFVASSAPSAGVNFNSVGSVGMEPREALTRLDEMPLRILLKRPENHDPAFRTLMDAMLRSISEARGGFGAEQIARLESSVFITSARTTTPIHFDPEVAFFTQIAGEKLYHVSPPDTMSETELEPFYIKSSVEIGTVDASRRDPAKEMVFRLGPGKGLHQPQNAPHWVETCTSRSISYSVVLETDVSRSRGRTRAFNHYSRKAGVTPAEPGKHQGADALKANAIEVVLPLRKAAGTVLRKLRSR